jgi:hypothetical protein
MERPMFWVLGIIVVLVALVTISKRRNRHDPSYDATTQGRVDDHQMRGDGDKMRDRFGGGPV